MVDSPSPPHRMSASPPRLSHSPPLFTPSPSYPPSLIMPSTQHSHSTTPSAHIHSHSSNSLSHASRPPRPAFPKIAVVCGAHTELGKLVVRELLRSSDVERVHALASIDPRDEIHIREHEEQKLRLVVDSLEYIEDVLKHAVDEVDVAFCCLGSSKQDYAALGPFEFRKINFDIPRRFVREMFSRSVQRVAVLSHVSADVRSSNEFLKVKGELVHLVKQMQLEGGRYAPGISLLRVPLLLTNLKDTNGLTGTKISALNEIKQKVALKFDLGPSQAVHVRDVAKAMVADTLRNADAEEESDLAYRFKKQQVRFSELCGPDIVSLAQETRALQRSVFSQGLGQGAGYSFLENVHGYGSEGHNETHQYMDFSEGGSVTLNDEVNSQYGSHNGERLLYGNQAHAREHEYDNIVPDPHITQIGHDLEGSFHGARNSQEGPNFERNQRTFNPASRKQDIIESAVDSVQALARHLHRSTNALEGNSSALHGQNAKRRARPQRPTEPFAQHAQNIHYTQNDLLGKNSFSRASVEKQEIFICHRNKPLGSFVNSSDSLSSPVRADRYGVKGVGGLSDFDVGDNDDRALMFAEHASVDDLPHYTYESPGQVDPYANELSEQQPFSTSVASNRESFGGEPDTAFQGDTTEHYGGVSQVSVMERFANLIGKAISATDRPSKQKHYKMRRPASQPEEFPVYRIRGNDDMRALGETSI